MSNSKELLNRFESNEHEANIGTVLNSLCQTLDNAHLNASNSAALMQMGIRDTMAEFISSTIQDPLNFLNHSVITNQNLILDSLDILVSGLVSNTPSITDAVYRSNKNGSFAQYFVILKDNKVVNRKPFFEFLNEYNTLPLSNVFPVHFDFISHDQESDIIKAKKIEPELRRSSPASQA